MRLETAFFWNLEMEVPSHIIHRKYFLNTNGLAQYYNVYVIKVIDITHVFFPMMNIVCQ